MPAITTHLSDAEWARLQRLAADLGVSPDAAAERALVMILADRCRLKKPASPAPVIPIGPEKTRTHE